MTFIATFIIGLLILIWFLRLGYQMGIWQTTAEISVKTSANTFGKGTTASPETANTPSQTGWRNRIWELIRKTPQYQGESASQKQILVIFLMALLVRIAIYLVSVVSMMINSDAASFSLTDFLGTWNRWDAPHYISLAQKGYSGYLSDDGQPIFLVFFPLYPWLVRAAHIIIPNWELACLILSCLLYAVGCCFFYATICREYNSSIAYKTIVLLSVYPFSFFFGGMMTESLFLCTMAMGFYFISKHNWLAVGIVGIFCSLSRVQGILILGVAGVEFLITYPPVKMFREKNFGAFWKAVFTKGSPLLLTLVGNIIYFCLNYRVAGDAMYFSKIQSQHWFHNTVYFTNCLSEIWGYIWGENTNTMRMCIWIPEILLFLLTFLLIAYALKRHPLKYTAYLIVYTLICYSVSFLISAGRYMACAFPLFVIAGEWSDRHPKIYPWIIAISAMLMMVYMRGYFDWKQIM